MESPNRTNININGNPPQVTGKVTQSNGSVIEISNNIVEVRSNEAKVNKNGTGVISNGTEVNRNTTGVISNGTEVNQNIAGVISNGTEVNRNATGVISNGTEKDGKQLEINRNIKDIEEEKVWDELIGDEKPWKSLTNKEKTIKIVFNTTKVCLVFCLLYLFICSLDLLSSSFTLISGKSTGSLMNNEYLNNPIVGLVVGILLTVLLQSSSTSTSIIVSMVASSILTVDEAIPMIMGSNIGTSVTNTIVSLTQVGDKEMFRRAFSGATVHDMFNWMSVFVLLTLEIITGMLQKLTSAIVNSFSNSEGANVQLLNVITEPFVDLIIQIDVQVERCWGMGQMLEVPSMIKSYCECKEEYSRSNFTTDFYSTQSSTVQTSIASSNSSEISGDCVRNCAEGVEDSCHFIFFQTGMSDATVGTILLFMSLILLCSALIIIVKLLNSMLKGKIAIIIKKVLNADIPYVPWLTGYIAILIGAVMTFIVQSSSVFTSTLTPLIGMGIISVERAYPLTLGSNIGTTTTAMLAAMAVTDNAKPAIQIALVHLFFNIFGIMIYYPIPFMRVPIPMCKFLGNITANYRWFAIVYLVGMFLVLPLAIFGLSIGGPAVFWGVLAPILVFLICIVLVNVLQAKNPQWLPEILQSWDFLPLPFHSLEPYDKILTSPPCCQKCRKEDFNLEPREVIVSNSVEGELSPFDETGFTSSTSDIIKSNKSKGDINGIENLTHVIDN